MSIPVKRIGKVVIGGNWYSVALDSFEVVEMEFTDDDGQPIHDDPLETRAYRFHNDNKDLYYGPLSEIQLYKLIDV
jgi:hypothetical protein